MKRGAYLGSGAALLGSLSGCTGTLGATDPTPTRTPFEAEPIAGSAVPRTIREEPVRDIDVIEIVAPAFGPGWAGLEVGDQCHEPTDETVVVGVDRAGRARAYPLSTPWYHEFDNDRLGGPPSLTARSSCPRRTPTSPPGDGRANRPRGPRWPGTVVPENGSGRRVERVHGASAQPPLAFHSKATNRVSCIAGRS